MRSPFKVVYSTDRDQLVIVWDAYIALLTLEAQIAAVKTAIAEKRFTRTMCDAMTRILSEEEIAHLIVLLNREVTDAD